MRSEEKLYNNIREACNKLEWVLDNTPHFYVRITAPTNFLAAMLQKWLREYEKRKGNFFENPSPYDIAAQFAYMLGRHDDTVDFLLRALALSPISEEDKDASRRHLKREVRETAERHFRLGIAYRHQASDAHNKDLLNNSLENLETARKLFEEIDLKERIIDSLNEVGLIYTQDRRTRKVAIKSAKDAKKMAEKSNYREGLATAETLVGIVFYDDQNYSKAREHHQVALGIDKKTSTPLARVGEARDYFNLAGVEMATASNDNRETASRGAIKKNEMALQLYEKYGASLLPQINLCNELVSLYQEIEEEQKATKYEVRKAHLYKIKEGYWK